MKGLIVADWSKVDVKNREHAKMVRGAIQAFFVAPLVNQEWRAAIQHFTSFGDFPTNINPLIERFLQQATYDEGWKNVFDVRDFTSAKVSGFDIMDVSHGLTFDKIPTGGKVEVKKFSGSKTSVSFARYGDALGFPKEFIDDEQWWSIEDAIIAFRDQALKKKAQVHYDLIEAVPSSENVAWAAPVPATLPNTDPNYTAIRDMETINAAVLAIISDCKDKGYGITPQTTFVIVAPLQLRDRINRALGLLNQSLAGSEKGVKYNIQVVYTLMFTTTTKYYVCLPKKKVKSGLREELHSYSDFDILSEMQTMSAFFRIGAAIGDVEQFKRCSIA